MKLPRDLSGAEVVKALRRLGFAVTRQTGSHIRLVRGPARVTVPHHREIKPGVLQSILHQAHISLDELMEAM